MDELVTPVASANLSIISCDTVTPVRHALRIRLRCKLLDGDAILRVGIGHDKSLRQSP